MKKQKQKNIQIKRTTKYANCGETRHTQSTKWQKKYQVKFYWSDCQSLKLQHMKSKTIVYVKILNNTTSKIKRQDIWQCRCIDPQCVLLLVVINTHLLYSCIWSKVSNVKSAAVSRNYVFYFDSGMTIVSPSSQILTHQKKVCVCVCAHFLCCCFVSRAAVWNFSFSFFITAVILSSTFLSLNRFFPFKNRWIYKNIIYCTWRCLHFHQMSSDNRSSISSNNNTISKQCSMRLECVDSFGIFQTFVYYESYVHMKKKKMKFILT